MESVFEVVELPKSSWNHWQNEKGDYKEKYAYLLVKDVRNIKIDLNENWVIIIEMNYDGVVAIEVIEHLGNPYHFLRQIHKVLKLCRYLLITAPNTQNLFRRWHFFILWQI